MEFRDIKPPMPTLRLPEDYLYNPLCFEAHTSPQSKKTVVGTVEATSPVHNGHDTAHATLPSSTYLHRPLRFVPAAPHATPQRRRDRAGAERTTPESPMPSSTPQTPSQIPLPRSSAHSGNTSLIRRAHALAQEVAEWQRFEAAIEKGKGKGPHSELLSASATELNSSACRPTRATQLRAHHIYEQLEDREEAEHDIFHRPKGRPSSATSLRSPRRLSGATDTSTPQRRNATTPARTPRSTKAAELRQRHSTLLLEEMAEATRLRVEEEAKEGKERQRPASSHSSTPAPSPVSTGSAKARAVRNTGAVGVQSRNEERQRRRMASDGHDGRRAPTGTATPTRRRGSDASVSSKDKMKAAVSKYLDEQERSSEKFLAALSPIEKNSMKGDEEYDAPAALPAPKQRRRRGEVAQPLLSTKAHRDGDNQMESKMSVPRRQPAAAGAGPPSPEPRPPPASTVSPAAVAHVHVPPKNSSVTTAQPPPPPPPPQRSTRDAAAQTKQQFIYPVRKGAAATTQDAPLTQQTLTAGPEPTAAAVGGAADTTGPPPAATRDTKSPTPSPSPYSSIEFDVATPSRLHSSVLLSPSVVPADHEEEEKAHDGVHHATAAGSRPQTHRLPNDVARTPRPAGGSLSSVDAARRRSLLSLDRDQAESSPPREHGACVSPSPASNRSPSASPKKRTPAKAAVEAPAPVPPPALSTSSRQPAAPKTTSPPATAAPPTTESSADRLRAPAERRGQLQQSSAKDVATTQPARHALPPKREEESPADEMALSQSFPSVRSFHSDDEAMPDAAEHPAHGLPAAHSAPAAPSPSADAATTQAQLLRYYRSANSSSVGPVRHAAPLLLPAALPMRTLPGDDVGAITAESHPHTAVEEIVNTAQTDAEREESAHTATTTRSSSRATARSSVSTASTSSVEDEYNQRSGSEGPHPHLRHSDASVSSPPQDWREEVVDEHESGSLSAPAFSFLADATADFSLFRGSAAPFEAGGGAPTHEPFGGGGPRAWGLPVPPTNHTHAAAAWKARQRAASTGGSDAASFASSKPPAEQHPKRRRPSTTEALLPLYEPRMEGPVWKDALDTVRVPQLQESNRRSPPTPKVMACMATEEEKSGHLTASAIEDVTPSASKAERMTAAPLETTEPAREKTDKVVETATANTPAVAINSTPASSSSPSTERPLASGPKPFHTSRLPARSRAAPQNSPLSVNAHVASSEVPSAPPPPTRTALSPWTHQRPYTVGGAGQHACSPTLSTKEDGPSACPLSDTSPVGAPQLSTTSPTKRGKARAASTTPATDAAPTNQQEAPAAAAPTTPSPAGTPPPAPTPTNAAVPPPMTEFASPAVKATGEKPFNATEGASPAPDSGIQQLSKYALWKAKQKAQLQAAEAVASPSSSAAQIMEKTPTQSRPSGVARQVMGDLADVHLAASPPAHAPEASSALGSTTHTLLGSQSMGGTEMERTPMERSLPGLLSDASADEMGESEGARGPLSHAPTPLRLRSPPPNVASPALERFAAVRDTSGDATATVTDSSSRAFSRSDTSTRSFSNAAAEGHTTAAPVQTGTMPHTAEREIVEGAASPTFWMAQTAGHSSSESISMDSDAIAAAGAPAGVDEGGAMTTAFPWGGLVGDSPPPSTDVTVAHDAQWPGSSSENTAAFLPAPAAVERDLRGAVEEASESSGSPRRCQSEQASEMAVAMPESPGLFSNNSSSLASTPVFHSSSLYTSPARVDGSAASALTPWSADTKTPEAAGSDKREDAEEEESVRKDEEAVGEPSPLQEPAQQRAPMPPCVANAAAAAASPPCTPQATATDDDATPSPFRPATPLPSEDFRGGGAPSLTSDTNPWSGRSSPARVWEGAATVSAMPSVAEDDLEVFRGATASSVSVPLARMQYVHQDL
ncbi:hypothetical protein ABB37_09208 [Leptomonas pyrrhocoris]|uniref:Uncharacterized protein n=1 Tax=Leptomonas pyrrhocoris TaxID=157538 RepID=A0A0N0VD35_LEPPY|nr:hypothetical protein ABB37_09208 [Leptomonas pyrrhocoris]XP_015653010.1 hypothetical protein ABB37_09208 [Leptomonas pyrrhocoris]KPA74570.1 hypothetical protein ABB37_09208 [Leptomonas pyrrhocoris]KPA74571.1 hypothetical protein ABB37_09208 [Leptomonas pyrrhocoris]|eukprot:XP_015653009.1 hypothetical protein ABB37_09208 [Leptomonas pyrrhocoris]